MSLVRANYVLLDTVVILLCEERHVLLGSISSWIFASAAFAVIIMMGRDGQHMHGSLVDYSFSRGHLLYMPDATTLHNTLLLDDEADAVPLVFEAGDYTSTITLRVEHPQVGDSEEVVIYSHSTDSSSSPSTTGGEHKLALPAGPLYGRVTLRVSSKLQFAATMPGAQIRFCLCLEPQTAAA